MENKIRAQLSNLNGSLDELEAQLEPLLAQSLPESLLNLETMQKAKLQVAIPYIVYDLVFIYLKTRGIDPKTHPVILELDRIRQYFDKIKNAEDPEKRRMNVDKAAANRFIKHAITQVKYGRPPGDNEGPSHIRFNEEADAPVPVKVTSKMVARAEYEKQIKELGSEEEEELEMIDDVEEEDSPEPPVKSSKGKGKEVDMQVEGLLAEVGRKRRRPAMDPFAGYGDDPTSEATVANASDNISTGDAISDRNTPLSDALTPKQDKKGEKKARKKARRTASSS
ncbi:hypothetical protein C8Q75DRAFT_829292 [Abortiporus biennis]|nr:hypothetical protein C8Q75DRAFT_829292 [Abortiporus biennis]